MLSISKMSLAVALAIAIGNNAFAEISPLEELDLSALDHVINIDAGPFSKDGCLYNSAWIMIDKI